MTEQEIGKISIDCLPDPLIGIILAFADYGAAKGELRCPAARFACVCKRWNYIFQFCAPFVTYQLSRVPSWTVRDASRALSQNQVGNAETIVGNAETIADSWVCPVGSRVPRWWTSDFNFAGGEWIGNYDYDSRGGPFDLRPDWPAPCLNVTFSRVVKLRAIAIAARNRPRLICLCGDDQVYVLGIPPPSPLDMPEIGQSYVPLHHPCYMDLVARELPQGSSPSQEALRINSALPVVLPTPLVCHKCLDIYILQSHERGWCGINEMVLLE